MALGTGLSCCRSIQTLYLSWNRLGCRGAVAIAAGVQASPSMQHLDLAWSGIGDHGEQIVTMYCAVECGASCFVVHYHAVGT